MLYHVLGTYFAVVNWTYILTMQTNEAKVSDAEGYIFSHSNFSLAKTSITPPRDSDYSIGLSPLLTVNNYKWLYLNLIYFDIANSTECIEDIDSGLVIKGSEKTLEYICFSNKSMPERLIQLDNSVLDLELEYKYCPQTTGDHRRGFVLFYKSKMTLHSIVTLIALCPKLKRVTMTARKTGQQLNLNTTFMSVDRVISYNRIFWSLNQCHVSNMKGRRKERWSSVSCYWYRSELPSL